MSKKLLFFAVLSVMAVSCLNSSYYNASYQVAAGFELTKSFYDADSIYYKQIVGMGDVYFLNSYSEATGEFGGCIMSMAHNLHPEECSPYSVYDTLAHNESDGFLLYLENSSSMPEHDIFFSQSSLGTCAPTLCYVHNTTQVAGLVRSRFTDGDWLKLTATGFKNGTETGSAEIYLADFREQKDSIVTTWTQFKLEDLGDIEYIDFEVTSSQDGIPGNFCIDDFYANVAISTR